MRDPLRLSPVHTASSGWWPPLAPGTPDAAEVAAHVARQAGHGPEPARRAGSPDPDPEGPAGHARRGHAEEPAMPAAPQHDAAREAVVLSDSEERRPRSARASVRDGTVFYPVAPFGRPDPEQRAAALRLVDGIGLHLICPEARCRRAKRCRDLDAEQLPLCLWLHRGTCRFVLAGLAGRAQDEDGTDDDRAARRSGPADRDGRSGRPGWTAPGESLLGDLRRAGWPIERLARTREDGADEWSWEAEPEMCALVSALGRPGGTEP